MCALEIKRTNQFINRFRQIKLILDDQPLGEIAHAETKSFELAAGQHSLYAKIDWLQSEPLSIELKEGEKMVIELGCLAENNIYQQALTTLSILILVGSIYYYQSIPLFSWIILIFLWFIRDVMLSKGKSFVYYLFSRRPNYLYLKPL